MVIVTTNALSSPCSSFRRKPESSSFLLQSYPGKRDRRRWGWSTILLLTPQVQGFHSACGRAGNFLYSGLPALRRFAASCAVRAAPAAQCLCKESHQRNTPPVARSPGTLPSECANAFRVSLSAHPCARSELARILRAPLRAFPPRARRATGGSVWAASCRRSNSNSSRSHCLLLRQVCREANDRIDAVQGCTDSWITGAVRGAEHRRVRRKLPEGARARCARVGCQHMDVLSDDPAVPEKRRAVRFARCESDRRVRCLAFLVTFWALRRTSGANSEAGRVAAQGRMPGVMPKSDPLARRASGSSALQTTVPMNSRFSGNDGKERRWIPAFAGMTSNKETSTRASALGAP